MLSLELDGLKFELLLCHPLSAVTLGKMFYILKPQFFEYVCHYCSDNKKHYCFLDYAKVFVISGRAVEQMSGVLHSCPP